jgi:hypothetical protein
MRGVIGLSIGPWTGVPSGDDPRVDLDLLTQLTARNEELRAQSTVTVGPLIPQLEAHAHRLLRLLNSATSPYWNQLARLAAEMAWLTANAYADNSADFQSIRWAKLAARIADEVGDDDLKAHGLTRLSRTLLTLEQPNNSLKEAHGQYGTYWHTSARIAKVVTKPLAAITR